MRAGLRLETVAFTERALSSPEGRHLADRSAAAGAEIVEVSEAVMAAISPVASPAGVVAIAGRPDWTLDQGSSGSRSWWSSPWTCRSPATSVQSSVRRKPAVRPEPPSAGRAPTPSAGRRSAGRWAARCACPWHLHVVAREGGALGGLDGIVVVEAGGRPGRGGDPRKADLRQPLALLLGGEGPGAPPRSSRPHQSVRLAADAGARRIPERRGCRRPPGCRSRSPAPAYLTLALIAPTRSDR